MLAYNAIGKRSPERFTNQLRSSDLRQMIHNLRSEVSIWGAFPKNNDGRKFRRYQ